MLESISMINPAALDTNIILVIDRLQAINDPRIRAAVLAYLFKLYFDALGVDIKALLGVIDRGVKYAREHNTSEMRGLDDYLKGDCRVCT